MQIEFSKYHGAGNDFIMIDNRTDDYRLWNALTPEVISQLCTRHLGIGADGLILAIKHDDQSAPYTMGYFNADGSRAEMCGNGLRCLMKFLADLGEPVRQMEQVGIVTGAGIVASRFADESTIQVAMPVPSFNPKDAKINLSEEAIQYEALIPGIVEPVTGTAVGVGNPHFVLYSREMWEGFEVHEIGQRISIHEELFPEGVNVGFARKEGPSVIALVVYERGVGPTLACGSGAIAAVGAGIAENRLNTGTRIEVRMPGGSLYVTISDDWSTAILEGTAEKVFDGVVTV